MKGQRFYKHLRNKKIDYSMGRFFVTMQVEHNRSILGTIVGEKCILNELGIAVKNVLTSLPQKYPELELGEFIVMPNHLHAIFTIKERTTNKKNHLGFLVGRFKGATTFLYGKLKQAGKAPDIGEHLWQIDYWEDLISSTDELLHYERYIRNNPKNWSRDHWGAITAHMLGNESLLDLPKRAFVASQGFSATELKPQLLSSRHGTSVPTSRDMPLISTFTSPQEREILRRALAKKRSIIHVCPQGIPTEQEFTPEQQQALVEKRILFLSPQPQGSKLNKQVATWCNEYVLRHASEIWVGNISPNGMLDTMLSSLLKNE
ncbi:MAG: transposase [Akkermansia sp.]|nr:transposase [Akkermansia sp.]